MLFFCRVFVVVFVAVGVVIERAIIDADAVVVIVDVGIDAPVHDIARVSTSATAAIGVVVINADAGVMLPIMLMLLMSFVVCMLLIQPVSMLFTLPSQPSPHISSPLLSPPLSPLSQLSSLSSSSSLSPPSSLVLVLLLVLLLRIILLMVLMLVL